MFLASTRLGLIACRHLVEAYCESRYISAPEIAERYGMNVRALMPALRQLTRAGLLRSRTGGNEPGFIFSRDPGDISLLELMTVLEGETEFLCCRNLIQGLNCNCKSIEECHLCTLLGQIIGDAKSKLASVSLEDYSKGIHPPLTYRLTLGK